MLWLYGNGFPKKAELLFLALVDILHRKVMQKDLGMIEQCMYQIRASRSESNKILEINVLQVFNPHGGSL